MKWLVLLALLPFASALDAEVTWPTEPLVVGREPAPASVEFTFNCQDHLGSLIGDQVMVTLQWTSESSFTAVTGPSSVLMNCANPLATATAKVDVQISAGHGDLAHEPISLTLEYDSSVGGGTEAGTVQVAEVFVLAVKVDGRVQTARGGPNFSATYPVSITNFGNSRVELVLADDKLQWDNNPILDSGTSTTATISVSESHYSPGSIQYKYNLSVIPVDALTGTEGEPGTAALVLHTKGTTMQGSLIIGITTLIVAVAAVLVRKSLKKAN